MSKEILKRTVEEAGSGSYSWSLYFFKIDRRNNNPYIVHKIRFRNGAFLQDYTRSLMEAVGKFQIDKIEEVRLYTGDNSKVSCDKISLENELMKEEWDFLFKDMAEASDQKITGKYNGYILTGIPADISKSPVTMVKMVNPVIEVKKQRSIVFNFTAEDELDLISDDICRLYMDADMIIIKDWLYSFNLKVETLFNMEKTMRKIKCRSIDDMLSLDAFADKEIFQLYANSYTSPRTFLSLSQERMDKLRDENKRKEVAELLKLKTSAENRICFENKKEAALLIKYICFKIFKDYETKGLLEASEIIKVER